MHSGEVAFVARRSPGAKRFTSDLHLGVRARVEVRRQVLRQVDLVDRGMQERLGWLCWQHVRVKHLLALEQLAKGALREPSPDAVGLR